jgi:hypothetical protein
MSSYGFLTDSALSPRESKGNAEFAFFLKVSMFLMQWLRKNFKGINRDNMKPLNNTIGKIAVL